MTLLLKRLLLLLPLALVLGPVLQAKFHLVPETPLAGAFTLGPSPEYSWAGLKDNTFQPELERYLEDRIGFRPLLVRIRNQFRFSVFRASTNSYAIIGREGMLFQDAPVNAYLGIGALKPEEVQRQVRRLRQVQQDLAAQGLPFLLVLAPNKARHFPQFLPASLPPKAGPSNYELFSAEMKRQGIELLDTNPLFKTWADTARYPLFSWSGTHWNAYGATLAADTILNRIEALVHAPLPRLQPVAPPIITDSANAQNDDLGMAMNLLMPVKAGITVFPRLGPAPARPGEQRPNLLLVGDSFNWGLMAFSPFIQHSFAPSSRFWYYNRTAYIPDSFEHKDPAGEDVNKLDRGQQLKGRQILVVLLTDFNLGSSELGLTDQLYAFFHPLTQADNARIRQIETELIRKASWEEGQKPDFLNQMHEKALAAFEKER